jgi:hypothetical protein
MTLLNKKIEIFKKSGKDTAEKLETLHQNIEIQNKESGLK